MSPKLLHLGLLGAVLLHALTSGAQPVITSQPANQTVVLGGTANFSVMVTGVGPFTYQWQLNGTNLPNNIITTIAGNGTTNYTGDGGAAINAGLDQPTGIGLDAAGNLFIADTFHNRIRKVDTNGIITTVAGNGGTGYNGDNKQATNATIYWPQGVTVDTAGNLYIADYNNNRIRLVNTNGIISTVAGTGGGGFIADGYPASNFHSSINGPSNVALGSAGDWYISDQNNERIRKVAANGIMTTLAGNGGTGYSGDGGAATNATFHYPNWVAVDAVGNLYIADYYNERLRKVYTNGVITTFAGNGGYFYPGDGGAATNAGLYIVSGVCLDSVGNVYIATRGISYLGTNYGGSCIRKVDTNGIITTIAGTAGAGFSGDGGPATRAAFSYPYAVALDSAGNTYITDIYNNCIREIHATGWPTYILNNVGVGDAGNYSVIITSASGSVTSSVASLSYVLPPISPSFTATNGVFTFQWSAVSNLTYQLQYATNLVAPAWTDLGSPITATNSSVIATDVLGTDSQRYYRVRLVQ